MILFLVIAEPFFSYFKECSDFRERKFTLNP